MGPNEEGYFGKHELEPPAVTEPEIEVRSYVTHTVTVKHVHEWLQRGPRTPTEAVLKERLKQLLERWQEELPVMQHRR